MVLLPEGSVNLYQNLHLNEGEGVVFQGCKGTFYMTGDDRFKVSGRNHSISKT